MGTAAKPTRENRTITVDFQNETTYFQLLGDGKAFVECVLAFLLALGFQLAHKATCKGGGCLTRHSHYIRDRESTRLNSSHGYIPYAGFCLKKKNPRSIRATRRTCTTTGRATPRPQISS